MYFWLISTKKLVRLKMYLFTQMTENSHIPHIKTTIITTPKGNTKAGLVTVRQGSLPSG